MQYINLTPRWTEILPTWRRIAINNVNDSNFWDEMERMAQAADNFNDLVTQLKEEADYNQSKLEVAIIRGREINERERNTIRETENDLS